MDASTDQGCPSGLQDLAAIKLRERDRLWEYRFVCLLLLVLLGMTAYHYFHSRINHTLRAKVQELLERQFPEHLVALETAHLEPGRGLLLEGFTVALKTPEGPRVIARIPRVIAQGDLNWVDMIQGKSPIKRVILDSVDLSIWPMADGRVSLQSLQSDQPIPDDLPPIEVRRGLVRILQPENLQAQEMIFHDLSVQLRPVRQAEQAALVGVEVQASVRGSFFSRLSLQLNLSQDKRRWAIQGDVQDLFYSSQWTDKLPQQWRTNLAQLAGLQAKLAAEFAVDKEPQQAVAFLVRGHIRDGRLQHPRLPYPLEELAGELYLKNDLMQLRQANARSGAAIFQLEADVYGLTLNAPLLASLQVKHLDLDHRLFAALPQPIQEQWLKLNLAGTVDGELVLQFDGMRWQPEILIHARQASVDADIFPYPLTNVCGDFHYRDGLLISEELTAMAEGQTVRGWLRLARASPKWLIELSVSSDGPIPIDDHLIQALTPRGQPVTALQRFVEELSPRGMIDIKSARFVRSASDIQNLSKSIELSFYDSSLRYQGFRYPIFDIQGHISVDDQQIRIQRFKGRNDSARIHCEGLVTSDGPKVSSVQLKFDSQNVPLEEELQAALPESVRELWTHLRPSGVVDRVLVSLERNQSDAPWTLAVRVQEDGGDDAVVGRSVSMQPRSLPYLLSRIACDVSYRPGTVQLHRFDASHDSSHISAEGGFQVTGDGSWNGILTWLPTTRLNVDQGLLISLPDYMRGPLTATEFRGPLAISGQTLLKSDPAESEPKVQAWDLQVEIEDGQLAGGGLASGIRGSMHVLGENTEQGPQAKGFLVLDSLAVRGIPVTQLTGPIAIAESKLLFGRMAEAVQVAPLAARLAAARRNGDLMQALYTVCASDEVSEVVPASATILRQGSATATPVPATLNQAPVIPWTMLSNEQLPQLDTNSSDLKASTLAGNLFLYGSHPLLEGRTELNLALVDADLAAFLADIGEGQNQADGRLWMQCQIVGSLTHTNTLSGTGQAWLRQANFYQMPVMTRLFRVLSVKPPDDGAFESADVLFRIDGDRIPIDRISLDGDIISLRGSGWVNLRRELRLDLYAYIGNHSPMAAVFGPLISQNDSATMLQLEVTGTTDQLDFRRGIPLMGTNFQQIFPERVGSPERDP
jgi:hypothetical protein